MLVPKASDDPIYRIEQNRLNRKIVTRMFQPGLPKFDT